MKKIIISLLALALMPLSIISVHAATAGVGFDIQGNFYKPADSNYQGIGTGVGIDIQFDENLTMGYRTEELNVRYEEAVGATSVGENYNVVFQGITGYYRAVYGKNLNVDFGLWIGAATTADFAEGATTPLTSPFVEPMGRIMYTSEGKVMTKVLVGIGYRFVRQFTLADASVALAGNQALKNFDGMNIFFGVGVSF
jgi:hypothetical protein